MSPPRTGKRRKRKSWARTGRLPRKVVGFWLVVDSLSRSDVDVPQEVATLAQAIRLAVLPPGRDISKPSYRPKTRLNRSCAALRREHKGFFSRVLRWLKQPEIQELFARKGHSFVWHCWMKALPKLDDGELASRALGIRAGRPRRGFTRHHDAALFAEYLIQCMGQKPAQAEQIAMRTVGLKGVNLRKLREWRTRVRRIIGDRPDRKLMLAEQAFDVLLKYELK